MYGGLQGLNKSETAAKHGEDQVKIWRRAYDIPPPPLELSDKRWPGFEEKYKVLNYSLFSFVTVVLVVTRVFISTLFNFYILL